VTRASTSSSYPPVCVAAGSNCDSLDTSASTTAKATCDVTTVATGVCTSGTGTTATSCGGVGQPCCVSNYSSSTSYEYCAAPGTRCLSTTSSSTGTTQYLCTACGDKGQRCCYDGSSTSSSSTYYGYGSGCKSPYICNYNSGGSPSYVCTSPTTTTTGG
jgi:hypothetical protein